MTSNILTHALAWLLILTSIFPGRALAESTIELYRNKKTQGSLSRLSMEAREVYNAAQNPIEIHAETLASGNLIQAKPEAVEAILSQYEIAKSGKLYPYNPDILQKGVDLAEFAIEVGSEFVPGGPLKKALIGAGTKVLVAGSNAAISQLRAELKAQALGELEANLSRLNEAELDKFRNAHSFTPRDYYKAAYGVDISTMDVQLSQIDEDARPFVVNARLEALETSMTAGLVNLDLKTNRLESQVKDIETNVKGLAAGLSALARETQRSLRDIQKNQQDIEVGIRQLTVATEQNTKDIAFVQEFMFGKMTTEEQLSALKGGMFRGMSQKDRAELTTKIELVQKRENLVKAFGTALQGADLAINVAAKFGVNPKVLGKISKGVQVGSAALNTFTSIVSGNYLGAATALFSVFGGGGVDAGQMRHEEVMAALQGIKDDLNDLKVGQQEIMRSQQEIYRAVIDLSNLVIETHEKQMLNIDRARNEILFNRGLLVELIQKDVEHCHRFLKARTQFASFVNEDFQSNEDLFDFLRSNNRRFQTCWDGLESALFLPEQLNGFKPSLLLASESSTAHESTRASQFESDHYRPLLGFVENTATALGASYSMSLNALTAPASSTNALFAKLATLTKFEDRFFPDHRLSDLEVHNQFKSLLSVMKVRYYVGYAVRVQGYVEFLRNSMSAEFCTHAQFRNGECASNAAGSQLLKEGMPVLNSALAQQVMLDGDMALPYMKVALFHPKDLAPMDASEAALHQWIHKNYDEKALLSQQQEMIRVISENPRLAKNLIIYALRREIEDNKQSVLSYRAAFEGSLASRLNSLVTPKSNWKFTLKDSGWTHTVNFGNESVEIPLPGVDSLIAGALEQSIGTSALLTLKNKMVDALISYDFTRVAGPKTKGIENPGQLTKKQVKQLRELYLMGVTSIDSAYEDQE